jgi:hypothetical protein
VSGGTPITVDSIVCGPVGLATTAIVADGCVDESSCSATVVPSGPLAGDANGLAWTDITLLNGGISLAYANPSLTTAVRAPVVPSLNLLALDTANLYAYGGDKQVYRAPRSTALLQPAVMLTATLDHDPVQLAAYGGYLYWADSTSGTISRASTSSSVPIGSTVITSGQTGPTAIAVDATSVYWINSGNGAVMKMMK